MDAFVLFVGGRGPWGIQPSLPSPPPPALTLQFCLQGSVVANAMNRIVSNRLFPGVAYPEKLESYTHRTTPPGGATLAADLRGTW